MKNKHRMNQTTSVAPLAGAWIEIRSLLVCGALGAVAPLAGAWIEISSFLVLCLH